MELNVFMGCVVDVDVDLLMLPLETEASLKQWEESCVVPTAYHQGVIKRLALTCRQPTDHPWCLFLVWFQSSV